MQVIWKQLSQGYRRQLLSLLVGGLVLRGAIAFWLPPGFDEAYYYLYTRHLDWSYFDHPLLVALTTGFGVWLTGDVSQFSIRLGTLLLYTASLFLLYQTSHRLFSPKAAVLTVAIASIVPIFLVGFGILTLPDSPLMVFWTAAMFVAACEFFPHPEGKAKGKRQKTKNTTPHSAPQTPNPTSPSPQPSPSSPSFPYPSYTPTYRLAILGLLVGLACLGKYHGLVLGVGLVGFCLTSPPHRVALRSPWLLAGLGLFGIAISPILIWNMQHDWVSLRFQSGRAVPDRAYSLVDLLVTVLAGMGYLFPTFGIPLWSVSLQEAWKAAKSLNAESRKQKATSKRLKILGPPPNPEPRTPNPEPPIPNPQPLNLPSSSSLSSPSRFILWLSLPLMLGFTLMGGYRSVLPTWPAPAFWSATLLLGQYAAGWQSQHPRQVRNWLWGSGILVVTLLLVVLSHVTWGTLQQSSRYALFGGGFPVSQDPSIQLLDIQQLRQGFKTSPMLLEALGNTEFLFTNDLFLAGQVGMAVAPLTPKSVTCLSHDLRGFAFWSTGDLWVGQDGLLITTAERAEQAIAQYKAYFGDIQQLAAIPIQRSGTIVQVIQVYRSIKLLQPYPRPYGL